MVIDPSTAFLAALIFAIHPLCTQSVAYISGRYSVLAGLFSVGAMGFMLTGHPMLAIMAVLLACAAKEDAVAMFGVVAFAGWLYGVPTWWMALAVPAVFAVAYNKRIRRLLSATGGEAVAASGFPPQLTFPTYQITAFTENMRRWIPWVLGFGLCADHSIRVRIWRSPVFWLTLLAFAALAILASTASFIYTLLFFWWLLPQLPYWLVPMPDPVMEQRLYLSMMPVSIALAMILGMLPGYITVAAIVLWTGATAWRSYVWSDRYGLWSSVLYSGGRQDRALVNMGAMWAQKGEPAKAERCFRDALELNPDISIARSNLASCEMQLGNTEESIRQHEESVRRQPRFHQGWLALGVAYQSVKQRDAAEGAYRSGLRVKPDFAPLLNRVGILCALSGRIEEAERHFREAVALAPESIEYRYNWAVSLQVMERFEEAQTEGRKLPQFFPLTVEMLQVTRTEVPQREAIHAS